VSGLAADRAGNLFWDQVRALSERLGISQHPFYRRWSSGGLAHHELIFYAEQYRHAVATMATLNEAVAHAAPDPVIWDEFEHRAAAERRQLERWDVFVKSIGGLPGRPPAQHTSDCLRVWAPPTRRFVGTHAGAIRVLKLYSGESLPA
jgi:hypothetical protein